VTFYEIYLQEHALNVTSYCNLFHSETAKDPCKIVDQIWPWKKMFIERMSTIYCPATKRERASSPLLSGKWHDEVYTILDHSLDVTPLQGSPQHSLLPTYPSYGWCTPPCTLYHLRVCSSTCAAVFQQMIFYWASVCHLLWARAIQSIHIYYHSEFHYKQSSEIVYPEMRSCHPVLHQKPESNNFLN